MRRTLKASDPEAKFYEDLRKANEDMQKARAARAREEKAEKAPAAAKADEVKA